MPEQHERRDEQRAHDDAVDKAVHRIAPLYERAGAVRRLTCRLDHIGRRPDHTTTCGECPTRRHGLLRAEGTAPTRAGAAESPAAVLALA